jgi:hypothetical protein
VNVTDQGNGQIERRAMAGFYTGLTAETVNLLWRDFVHARQIDESVPELPREIDATLARLCKAVEEELNGMLAIAERPHSPEWTEHERANEVGSPRAWGRSHT